MKMQLLWKKREQTPWENKNKTKKQPNKTTTIKQQETLKIILFHLCLISMYLRFFPPAAGAKIPSKWHTLFYVLSEYRILFLESSKKS